MVRMDQRVMNKIVGISAFLLASLAFAVWVLRPPLKVYPDEGKVIVDVQTLGEYNSSLSNLELAECESGNIVWRLEPTSNQIELWTFPLQVGTNSSFPVVGGKADFRTAIPQNLPTFTLKRGTCYRISIAPTGRLKKLFHVSETFVLQ